MEVKAIARDTGISARKMRLIGELVRGKRVGEALDILKFAPTPNAGIMAKIVKSAAANAENNYQLSAANLKIIRILVDPARTVKRFRAAARGRATSIFKRSSHITVVVAEQEA